VVRRVRSLSPGTRAICPATASEDAMPDPLSRIRRKLDCLKPISAHRKHASTGAQGDDRPFYEQTDGRRLHGHPPAPQLHRRAMDHAHRTALTVSARPARSRRTVAHRVATETDAYG
jgi:hypothetical protein